MSAFSQAARVWRVKAYNSVNITNVVPEALAPLETLATNLRWSWRAEAESLFESIDPELWSSTGRNPVLLLRSLPASRLEALAHDDDFLRRLKLESEDLENYLAQDRWFAKQTRGAEDAETSIAYFSMEFGITQALPVYSGGLGVLAGDHMKSASDLGAPITGIGLLYTYGYFSQTLSREGWQQENYSAHDPADLPISQVVDAEGRQLRVSVAFPEGRDVQVAVWKAQVGNVTLLLLGTDIAENPEDFRTITDRLYGGDAEHRVKQELVLGVGGVRAVQAYADLAGIPRPTVFHMNEGHAGFSGVERIGQFMAAGETYESAIAAVRASTIFTTHTPVPAGIDRFDMHLARRYLALDGTGMCSLVPQVALDRVMALGAEDDPSRFNMAHLGLRLGQYANGVAKLHGVVSRDMFKSLYAPFDADEVPITSVTNGVHLPTWVRGPMLPVVNAMSGNRDLSTTDEWENEHAIGSEELWRIRNGLRTDLVDRARSAVKSSWLARGAQEAELGWTRSILDPNVLTIGFARRVSTYKRLTLMLQDPERLARILRNEDRPVQFLIAGKAHPADMGGKQLLQEVVRFADEAGVRDRIVFLPDYNVTLAKYLCAGADVWLNNPVRPQEASGTSGMKAVMNGGLTFSISDGWWDEFRDDELGWTIPDVEHVDERTRDHLESQALYDILENEIAPLFYDRDERGVPVAWMHRVRASMTRIAPRVAAERMVRDYVNELYLPAGRSARRVAVEGAPAAYVEWIAGVSAAWHDVAVTGVRVATAAPLAGGPLRVEAEVSLGALSADDVRVEAVLGRVGALGDLEGAERFTMTPTGDGSTYAVDVPVDVPQSLGYTVRVVPDHELLRSPAELGLVRFPSA